MAQQFKVLRNTPRKNKMTAQRLASVKEYYFSIKLREVANLVQAGKSIINMGIGSPDLAPHPKVIEVLSQGMSHPGYMYQSYQGFPNCAMLLPIFTSNSIR